MPEDGTRRSDEFTSDAVQFGIDVPYEYGHITGCSVCRAFRQEVRARRADIAASEQAAEEYRLGYTTDTRCSDEACLICNPGQVPACGGDGNCDNSCRILVGPTEGKLDFPDVFGAREKDIDERIAVANERIAYALELIAARLA